MPLYAARNMRFGYAKSTFSEIGRGESVKAWYGLPRLGAFFVGCRAGDAARNFFLRYGGRGAALPPKGETHPCEEARTPAIYALSEKFFIFSKPVLGLFSLKSIEKHGGNTTLTCRNRRKRA